MESYFFKYRDSVIHYMKGGKGSAPLICFHGYGEQADTFGLLETTLSESYLMLTIDMPFHGQTKWNQGLDFSPIQLREIMEGIMSENSLPFCGMALAGYSMGGRIALAMAEYMPDKIERLVLLAPDGLKMNGWYWLSTHSRIGNQIFKYTMKQPDWFLTTLRLINKANLVNQSIYKFATSYLEDKEARTNLYTRWTCMRAFKPSPKRIQRLIIQEKILVDLIYGRFDRIIRFETGEKFCSDIPSNCRLTVLQTGHQLLHPKNLKEITKIFESRPN